MYSTTTHNNFIVEIDSHSQVNQPNMTFKGDFYKTYSPKNSNSDQEPIFI